MPSLKPLIHVGMSQDLFLLLPYSDMREAGKKHGCFFFVKTVLNVCGGWVGVCEYILTNIYS